MRASPTEKTSELEWMLHHRDVPRQVLAEALAREYYGLLFQFAYLFMCQPTVADAAARAVIHQAVDQSHRYTGEIPLRTWLLAACLSACKNLLWQFYLGRMVGGGLKEAPPFFMDLENPLKTAAESAGEQARPLVELIKAGDSRQQSLLFLVFIAGLDIYDTAVVLRMEPAQVGKHLEKVCEAARLVLFPEKGTVEDTGGHLDFNTWIRASQHSPLEAEEQAALDVHLMECSICRAYSAQLGSAGSQIRLAAQAAFPLLRFSPQTDLTGLVDTLTGEKRRQGRNKFLSLSRKETWIGVTTTLLLIFLALYGSSFRVENDRPIRPTPSPTDPSRNITIRRITATPEEPVTVFLPQPTPELLSFSPGLKFQPEVFVDVIQSESRSWSVSGPAALAILLGFWDWPGNPVRLMEALQPNPLDAAVLPADLERYVSGQSNYRALYRQGGDVPLLHKLLDAGYPVILQRGEDTKEGWYGHFQVVSAYDVKSRQYVVQQVFPEAGERKVDGEKLHGTWKSFNYAFLLVFPREKEEHLLELLGDYASPSYAAGEAARIASHEILIFQGTSDRSLFFAWFNRATSLAYLEDYYGAAKAYDEAHTILEKIPEARRPWRIFWYQTRPYWAYFYTGRYTDVIQLADEILERSDGAAVEESLYWRSLAKEAVGDRQGALEDLHEAVRLNPNFTAGKETLRRMRGES
jgi:tetratricopeptide (TPR) repeat protein/DNA-directed RNA polymerase specialized sigma24 family protein